MFTYLISALIILNIADLALDRYPIETKESEKMEKANIIISFVFVFEMIIKVIAFGMKSYFKDSYNIFDTIIVTSACVDFVFYWFFENQSAGVTTSLRALRLLRIFKLARYWPRFRYLIKTLVETAYDISTFSIVLFIFIFTYTLLGRELFAHKVLFDQDGNVDLANGTSSLPNFDTFLNGITSVFIVIANDSWTSIFTNCYRAVGPYSSTIYFYSLAVIG